MLNISTITCTCFDFESLFVGDLPEDAPCRWVTGRALILSQLSFIQWQLHFSYVSLGLGRGLKANVWEMNLRLHQRSSAVGYCVSSFSDETGNSCLVNAMQSRYARAMEECLSATFLTLTRTTAPMLTHRSSPPQRAPMRNPADVRDIFRRVRAQKYVHLYAVSLFGWSLLRLDSALEQLYPS